jgi:hypothetical protein
MISGGIAGTLADALLHGMDTLKTRMQGQMTTKSTKYSGIASSLRIIIKEEGIRGLFGGFTASIVGSLFSTTFYFGFYELSKQKLKEAGINPTVSYFIAGNFVLLGGLADTVASAAYVPSEVLKTRLQLQGRYNNPHSLSAHNYKNTIDAIQSVIDFDVDIPKERNGWIILRMGCNFTERCTLFCSSIHDIRIDKGLSEIEILFPITAKVVIRS